MSIILPNAGDGGHKTILRTGFHTRFATLPFDGVYIDGAYAGLGDAARRRIYGEGGAWGSRRRGVLPTGDNRDQNFQKLGAHDCWVRLGEPTVESIRQAVLADEARIAYEQPALPSHRILELQIDSTLTGPSFALSFNDGFTSLIGGRGSGKSAILEYLRFGLGRSAGDMLQGEEGYRERDQRLINDTLAAGSVSVVLERDRVTETWTRTGAHREMITVTAEDGAVVQMSVADAQQRFRARAFYQKELSSLVLDRARTAEQMTGIAAAEFVDSRRAFDREIAATKRDVVVAYQQLVEFWIAEGEHRRSVAAASDLSARLDAIRERMAEAGLSDEQQTMLRDAPTYRMASSLIAEARSKLVSDRALLIETATRFSALRPDHFTAVLERFPELASAVSRSEQAREEIGKAFEEAIASVDSLTEDRERVFETVEASIAAFDADHAQIVMMQESGRALYDEAQKVVGELQTAQAAIRQGADRLDALQHAPGRLANARTAVSVKLSALRDLLDEAATKVAAMYGNSLRAEVLRETAPKQQFDALFSMCDGNRLRELQTKCEDRVTALADVATATTWDTLVDALLEVRKFRVQTGAISIEISDNIGVAITESLFGDMTHQQLNGIFAKVDDSTIGQLLTATAEDFISFEYKDAGSYIPFAKASPGQQASALLQLLLNQEAGTLIVDQPEDDLDNRVIMDIAKLLQKTKRRRQLVFATHNPNFVVNGDADKIVAMKPGVQEAATEAVPSPRVIISVDGAIETKAVRLAVTETMEGGEAAFALRSRKYSFAAS